MVLLGLHQLQDFHIIQPQKALLLDRLEDVLSDVTFYRVPEIRLLHVGDGLDVLVDRADRRLRLRRQQLLPVAHVGPVVGVRRRVLRSLESFLRDLNRERRATCFAKNLLDEFAVKAQ